MHTIRTAMLALVLLALAPLNATAQTPIVLPAGQPVTVAWDAPVSGVSDAPIGYRFVTFRPTDTGVVVTTTDVPLNPTKATLPSTILPSEGEFLLAVQAFNASGVSARSNALLFVRPSVPGVPTALRLDVP